MLKWLAEFSLRAMYGVTSERVRTTCSTEYSMILESEPVTLSLINNEGPHYYITLHHNLYK